MSSSMPESPQPMPKEGPVTDNKDERMWASFCHLSGIVFGFLGPLVLWLIKKDQYPLVNDQGKEALNFQINILVYLVISVVLIAFCVGFVLLPAVVIYAVVMAIIATIKANQGIQYRYPMTVRVIS